MADARLVLNANSAGEFGYCPTVRFACDTMYSLIAVDFEYTGCSSAATAGLEYAGNLAMYIARDSGWAVMEYCAFSINRRALTGRIEAQVVDQAAGVSIVGSCRVTTSGVGEFQGDCSLQCDEQGWYSFSAASLRLTAEGSSQEVTLEELIVAPLRNASFVPDSGTMRFSMEDPTTSTARLNVNVQFTKQSPTDGKVLVLVDGQTPFQHHIPITVP